MKNPIRILQFGTSGQVAREMLRGVDERFSLHALSRTEADFLNPTQIASAIQRTDADIIINTTAYTAVDKAEDEESTAQTINNLSVGVLAAACATRGLPLIHVSTDYVFDGTKSAPYAEDDASNPLGVYGRSKFLGEEAIRGAAGHHVILRTSWVYSAHGSNFVKTMLRLAKNRDALRVVDDQHGAPTSATSIARAILRVAERIVRAPSPECYGTFHYTDAGETTWCRFAETIFRYAQLDVRVAPITTAEYKTPAQRPLNSRLNCSKIDFVYSLKRLRWECALDAVISEILAEGKA
jgi:dTDP-4-dehydrorhamnose reductase